MRPQKETAASGVGARSGGGNEQPAKPSPDCYHGSGPDPKPVKQGRGSLRKAELLAHAVEADRLFFERFPRRQHRIRIATALEVEESARGSSYLAPPARWFVVVRQIRPGARLRVLFPAPRHTETDQPEARCLALYEAVRPCVADEIESLVEDMDDRRAGR